MNICKVVIKTVILQQAEMAITLGPNGNEGWQTGLGFQFRGQYCPSVDSNHLTLRTRSGGTWKPCIAPDKQSGKWIVRNTHGSAGLGGWKKQILHCNGADTG